MPAILVMKQKELPQRFSEDAGISTKEIIELVILTLTAIGMGIGAVWFVIEALKVAIGG